MHETTIGKTRYLNIQVISYSKHKDRVGSQKQLALANKAVLYEIRRHY